MQFGYIDESCNLFVPRTASEIVSSVVAELKAENDALNAQIQSMTYEIAALNHEKAELIDGALAAAYREAKATIDAIPVDALQFCIEAADYTYDGQIIVAKDWLRNFMQPALL